MKKLLILAALSGCYSKDDAIKDIGDNGGPKPIECVTTGGGKYSYTIYDCRDGIGDEWKCSSHDGCVNFGPPRPRRAP